MLFNSFEFCVFFPAVLILYFLIPYRLRWILLLAASYFFYMSWKWEYASLLLTSTVVDYIVARQIGKSTTRKRKKRWLFLSLATNIGLLATFKYFNFFNENLTVLLDSTGGYNPINNMDLLLPVGISFYTFQTMAYTIDVYRNKIPPEKHIGKLGLYVSFFPQLVAGPIERAQNLLPQFNKKFDLNYDRIAGGFKQMLWGFFKKLVIADRLSIIVNEAYSDPEAYGGGSLLIATYCFAFQIYCDFSGYSDIAIGAARTMGYDLRDNFRLPYWSRSLREFWSRWHISLSTWFRDYVYIPLGGNRGSTQRWYFNLLVVFLISGLWHGANWTFVAWGAFHGVFLLLALLLSRPLKALEKKAPSFATKIVSTIVTFHLVAIGWVLFRADTIADGLLILERMFSLDYSMESMGALLSKGVRFTSWLSIVLLVGFIVIDPFMDKVVKGEKKIGSTLVNYLVYGLMLAIIVLFGHFGKVDFLYFQF